MGWIDKERNKLTQALYRRNAEDMPVTNLLPIFNFEAALTKMAERGCACNEETFDHHTVECYTGAVGAKWTHYE